MRNETRRRKRGQRHECIGGFFRRGGRQLIGGAFFFGLASAARSGSVRASLALLLFEYGRALALVFFGGGAAQSQQLIALLRLAFGRSCCLCLSLCNCSGTGLLDIVSSPVIFIVIVVVIVVVIVGKEGTHGR